jgi:hypothetical protein
MVRKLTKHCEAHGFEPVMTFPADGAHGFYEQNGFTRPPEPVVHRLGH